MTARSLTVDDALLRQTTREVAWLGNTRPPLVFIWAVLAVFLVGLTASQWRGEPIQLLVPLVVAVLVVLLLIRQSGRALRGALPVGSTLTVDVHESGLRVRSVRGDADLQWSAFRTVRAGRHAVLLPVRGSSVVTALPRRLVDDADLERMRDGIEAVG